MGVETVSACAFDDMACAGRTHHHRDGRSESSRTISKGSRLSGPLLPSVPPTVKRRPRKDAKCSPVSISSLAGASHPTHLQEASHSSRKATPRRAPRIETLPVLQRQEQSRAPSAAIPPRQGSLRARPRSATPCRGALAANGARIPNCARVRRQINKRRY